MIFGVAVSLVKALIREAVFTCEQPHQLDALGHLYLCLTQQAAAQTLPLPVGRDNKTAQLGGFIFYADADCRHQARALPQPQCQHPRVGQLRRQLGA